MLNYFQEFSVYALIMDLFWASALLFIAQIIRSKIKLLQNLFLPASVLAGLMGLFLGNQFLNVVVLSPGAGSYGGAIIIVLFASVLLGHTGRTEGFGELFWESRDSCFNVAAWEWFQWGIGILAGIFLTRTLFPHVAESVGMTMPSGFAGGYGYGGAVGTALENMGLEGGLGFGMTFATIGMLVAIICGMLNINIGLRKGYLNFTKELSKIPEDELSGFLKEEHQEPMGMNTMNSSSIDPLGWHVVLVLLAAGLGWLTNYHVKALTGADVPALCLALIWGFSIQKILDAVRIGKHVDKKVTTRIGSTLTDYMVFFGICTINKQFVATNWLLIVLLSVVGIIVNMVYFWVLCPRTYRNNWFERGIIPFGMLSGVLASGITLLRVVDPEFKSHALEDFGIAQIPLAFCDLFIVGVLPIFVGQGQGIIVGLGLVAASFAALAVLKITGCVHPPLTKTTKE